MDSPFPGMDPYLEQSAFWSPFHTRLIVALADAIMPLIQPQYYIEVETRSYKDTPEGEILVGIPDALILGDSQISKRSDEPSFVDNTIATLSRSPLTVTLPMPVTVKERYLEVREVSSDAVITVIEILSPANKRRGKGRDAYEAKRLNVLGSASHLVEIDLLRENPSLPINSTHDRSDYYILVSIARQRPRAHLYSFTIKETFPTFLMPLKQLNEAVPVDMQAVFGGLMVRARYASRIDYTQPVPLPTLSKAEQD